MAMTRSTILLAVLALAGCEPSGGPPKPFEPPPAAVTVATATAADVPLYQEEIGRCVARESVTLQPQVSGRIVQIHFTDGADVKPGDLLFTIDPRPFQAQVAQAEANLAQSMAERDLAKLELTRATTLLEKKAIAQQEVDTARNAVDVALAKCRQNEAALDTARLNLEYCTLRSPIEGRTGRRLVDMGNTVTANTTALLVIQRLDPIYADFSVTESGLGAVQKKMKGRTLQAEIRIPEEPAEPRLGELTFLDNAVQEGTGTVMLRATVQNGDRRLWPGRFVKVRLILDTIKGAVLVPGEAPQISAMGPFVYVISDDLTADLRPVKLGQKQGPNVVVQEGLKAGERVVTMGHIGVIPKKKVRIEEPRGSPQPPAQGNGN
jgi:multidrug efflux system membrane fusion protein